MAKFRPLITGTRGGGYKTVEGGGGGGGMGVRQVLLLQKGGRGSFSHAEEGGHTIFWGTFYFTALFFFLSYL